MHNVMYLPPPPTNMSAGFCLHDNYIFTLSALFSCYNKHFQRQLVGPPALPIVTPFYRGFRAILRAPPR